MKRMRTQVNHQDLFPAANEHQETPSMGSVGYSNHPGAMEKTEVSQVLKTSAERQVGASP